LFIALVEVNVNDNTDSTSVNQTAQSKTQGCVCPSKLGVLSHEILERGYIVIVFCAGEICMIIQAVIILK